MTIGSQPHQALPKDSTHKTTKAAIIEAIKAGYRHFDTAFSYRTEQPLGEAIAETLNLGLIESRDELFITSKLWSSFAENDLVVPATKMNLGNLQLDYIDLYLKHWPLKLSQEVRQMPVIREHIFPLDIKSVWEGMGECKNLGLTKAIGVSNFSCKKLQELLSTAKIPPPVNLVSGDESTLAAKEIEGVLQGKGYPCLSFWTVTSLKRLQRLKEKPLLRWEISIVVFIPLLCLVWQISMRWLYEQGVSSIAKSFNKERMKENLDILD
ncbi:hypothetical protein CRYUN_Cryun21dG0034400 [Craigia yunnanensis]